PMTPGTSTRFLLVATRVPDRRMQSHSEYAYYKPSPWTSSKTSSPRSARSGRLEGRYLDPCSETHAARCARAAVRSAMEAEGQPRSTGHQESSGRAGALKCRIAQNCWVAMVAMLAC